MERVGSGSPYESEFGFSRAIRDGRRILVAGTAPIGPNGTSVGRGHPAQQARRCLDIILEAVRSLGGRAEDVVRTRIFLTRSGDWEAVAAVHGEVFGDVRPVATCVVVNELLRPEWDVEIEAEAWIGDELRVDACTPQDRLWIEERSLEIFNGTVVVSWGVAHKPAELPGFVARRHGERVGLATYKIEDANCELVTIDALQPHQGVGTALLEAVEEAAAAAGCGRLWLICTNDNLDAHRFYQRRGFTLADVHPDALAASRKLKPTIPLIGHYGIPLRDELVFEKNL